MTGKFSQRGQRDPKHRVLNAYDQHNHPEPKQPDVNPYQISERADRIISPPDSYLIHDAAEALLGAIRKRPLPARQKDTAR